MSDTYLHLEEHRALKSHHEPNYDLNTEADVLQLQLFCAIYEQILISHLVIKYDSGTLANRTLDFIGRLSNLGSRAASLPL